MDDRQRKSLDDYLDRIDGHTVDGFKPEIGDRRDEPTYVGWVFADRFRICIGIEPDGYLHS